jgi:hypothetical protein
VKEASESAGTMLMRLFLQRNVLESEQTYVIVQGILRDCTKQNGVTDNVRFIQNRLPDRDVALLRPQSEAEQMVQHRILQLMG